MQGIARMPSHIGFPSLAMELKVTYIRIFPFLTAVLLAELQGSIVHSLPTRFCQLASANCQLTGETTHHRRLQEKPGRQMIEKVGRACGVWQVSKQVGRACECGRRMDHATSRRNSIEHVPPCSSSRSSPIAGEPMFGASWRGS